MFETVGSGTSSLLACSISRSQLECICCSESLVAMYSSIFDMENIFWGKYEAMLGLLVMIELYNKLPYILTKTHVEWSLIKFLLQFKRPLHSRDNRIWANYGNIYKWKKPCRFLYSNFRNIYTESAGQTMQIPESIQLGNISPTTSEFLLLQSIRHLIDMIQTATSAQPMLYKMFLKLPSKEYLHSIQLVVPENVSINIILEQHAVVV